MEMDSTDGVMYVCMYVCIDETPIPPVAAMRVSLTHSYNLPIHKDHPSIHQMHPRPEPSYDRAERETWHCRQTEWWS